MKSNLKLVRPVSLLLLLIGLLSYSFYHPLLVKSAATHVVISEVQLSGDATSFASTDEFIELYNPTGSSVDLTGWKLQKLTASQDAAAPTDVLTLTGSIAPHGYRLLAHTNYDGTPTEDQTYTEEAFSTNNTVIIRNSSNTIVDMVGFGTAATFEGSTKPSSPGDNASRERKAVSTSDATSMNIGGTDEFLGNGEDTDQNGTDFVNRTIAQPQNSQSNVEPALTATATPSASPTATATATPSSSPTVSPTSSPTMTPSPTATPTVTPTVAPTATATPTVMPSLSPKPTKSPRPFPGFGGFACRMEFVSLSFGFF